MCKIQIKVRWLIFNTVYCLSKMSNLIDMSLSIHYYNLISFFNKKDDSDSKKDDSKNSVKNAIQNEYKKLDPCK